MKIVAALFVLAFTSLSVHAASPSHFKKVVYIVFENTKYAEALKQPFFGQLAQQGTLFSNFTAETHPSQGNYIAMVAGDTFGIRHDFPVTLKANHLGDLVEASGRDWRVYAEGYPGNCYLGGSKGSYVRKHVPFLSFENVTSNPTRCAKIVNAQAFDDDVAKNRLPEFSMFVPDQRSDGHDTGAKYADAWFNKKFGPLLENGSLGADTLLIVTFDENDGSKGNQIYTVVLGAKVAQQTLTGAFNHYSLLRMIEDEWNLGTLNANDAQASPIPELWK